MDQIGQKTVATYPVAAGIGSGGVIKMLDCFSNAHNDEWNGISFTEKANINNGRAYLLVLTINRSCYNCWWKYKCWKCSKYVYRNLGWNKLDKVANLISTDKWVRCWSH